MSVTFCYDVTALFYSKVPQGRLLCGYDTGSSGIAWTPAMWAAHAGAVHIDQAQDTGRLKELAELSPGPQYAAAAHHLTSDVLDVEAGAVPVGSPLVAAWAKGAKAAFSAGTRPGQRRPALYQSLSNVSANVNALVSGGVTSGVGLWIAKWDGKASADIAALAAAAGPFPVIGFQYSDEGEWDDDVFSTAWLDDVSGTSAWTFGPCRAVSIWGGATTTFGVEGLSPGTPAKEGVVRYEIAVWKGTRITDPVLQRNYVPKSATTSVFTYSGHGLVKGQQYLVGVRALGLNDGHASPWVTALVKPGS